MSPNPNRIWTNLDAEEENPTLIRLTVDTLFLAVIAREDMDKTIDILNRGGSPAWPTSSACAGAIIPLSDISKMKGEAEDSNLEVTYHQGQSKQETKTISLVDASQRDELLAGLTAALGPSWSEKRRQKNRLLAVLLPLGCLVAFAVAGWLVYLDAQWIAAGGHPKQVGNSGRVRLFGAITHWVAGLLGPTGVLVVAGLLVGSCLIWLAATLIKPPIIITVEKTQQPT